MRRLYPLLLWLIGATAFAADPAYHYQTGTSREVAMSGSGNTNVSSLIYVPSADKWLVSQQDCSIWVLDGGYPSDSSTTRTLGNCGSTNDIESIFLVDPYNERGFGDVLMAQSERGTQLCEYSLSGVLNNTDTAVIRSWDLTTLLGITDSDNNNEGITFVPGDTNCTSTKHGGCYLISLCQGSGSCDCVDGVGACGTTWAARTFVRFKIDSSENLTVVGSTFTLDTVCDGYLESDVAELQYDFAVDQIYVLDDNTNAVCVLDGTDYTLATRVAGFSAPSAAQEGLSVGRGLMLYANDTPAPPTTQDVAAYKGSRRDTWPPWKDTAWRSRRKLVIDKSKVPADYAAMPMLVQFTADAALANAIQADGGDVLFTDAGGVKKLTHEIARVDSAAGSVQAWVMADVDHDASTVLYMYYSNADSANQWASDAWPAAYVGVYHFEGDASDNTPNDSSGEGNHMTENGDPSEDATGNIGRGIGVARGSSWLITPYGSGHNLNTTNLSVCAWFCVDVDDTADQHVFMHGNSGANDRYYWRTEGGGTRVASRVGRTNPTDDTYATAEGTWYRACMVADAEDSDVYYAYHNGTVFSYVNGISFTGFTFHAADWTFGGAVHADTGAAGEGFTGRLDEIWIRKSAPLTTQIQAEYNNQSAPGVGGWLYSATDEVCPRRAVH